ncbi:MAG: hypothetical protein AABY74_05105 [Planctomycetota bacterium]
MKKRINNYRRFKVRIHQPRMGNYRFRRPQGMSATILQWFALDLEPPSCGQGRRITTLGE